MKALALQHSDEEGFYSREGYWINIYASRWVLNKDVEIPVFKIKNQLKQDIQNSFIRVLAFYATTAAPAHCRNLFERIRHYLEATTGQPPFGIESLLSYRSMLDNKTEWYLASIRVFIRKWSRLGYIGIDKDVIQLLAKWKIKGNEKGYAVQSMCPENGPLTDMEMLGVIDAVTSAVGKNQIPLLDSAYILTSAMTGRRPVQITALKIKDLLKKTNSDGIENYYINFPRAKQRNEGWRSTFEKFSISEDLWIVLQQQASAVKKEFASIYNIGMPDNLTSELPIFPDFDKFDEDHDLKTQIFTDRLHAKSESVKFSFIRILKIINVFSERTGEQINLNPTRFRYTLGTNLAREGKGEYIIAKALDHSDIQNAGVYVKNIPEIVERIDKAVALQLAPIAQAFQGVVVISERDAVRGNDPSSRISNGSKDVGTCGSYGFCGALAPVACYTCSHFQPWLDGPHEEVLDGLIRERDKVYQHTNDLKIASVNDRLILAVGDVVTRCKAIKDKGSS